MTLSVADVDAADVLATELGSFTRVIVDGPTGDVISFDGRAGSMVQNPDGTWLRDPNAPTVGSARRIGRVPPLSYRVPAP